VSLDYKDDGRSMSSETQIAETMQQKLQHSQLDAPVYVFPLLWPQVSLDYEDDGRSMSSETQISPTMQRKVQHQHCLMYPYFSAAVATAGVSRLRG
jgi:hypothetical protein